MLVVLNFLGQLLDVAHAAWLEKRLGRVEIRNAYVPSEVSASAPALQVARAMLALAGEIPPTVAVVLPLDPVLAAIVVSELRRRCSAVLLVRVAYYSELDPPYVLQEIIDLRDVDA